MTLLEQTRSVFVETPAAPWRLSSAARRLALAYMGCAALIVGVVGTVLLIVGPSVRDALLAEILPPSMHDVGYIVVTTALRTQTFELLANAMVTGSLLVVSLALFPLKEKLSRRVERDHQLDGGRAYQDHPLWFQGLEELKLLLLYVAVFIFLFWLGYDHSPVRKTVAVILSFLFTWFTWAVDFAAPTPQRHRLTYSQVIKAVLRRPLASLGFGALVSAPVVITTHAMSKAKGVDPAVIVAVVFGLNVLAMTWAAIAGTWLGARLIPVAEEQQRSHVITRCLVWLLIVGTIAVGAIIAASVADSLRDKTHVLKCDYDVDWSTVRVSRPALGGLLAGQVDVGLSFDLDINNPTDRDVVLEDSRIALGDSRLQLAEARLQPIRVPAGATSKEHVDLRVSVDAKVLLDGFELNPERWRITLWVTLDNGLDVPIFLKSDARK